MRCPKEDCDYESDTERGVNIHHSKKHGDGVDVICSWCGDDIDGVTPWRAAQSDTLFCNHSCQAKWQSDVRQGIHEGKDNPNWVGGVDLSKYYQQSFRENRIKAQIRAQGRCEHPTCDKTPENRAFDVHHIVPFRLFDDVTEGNDMDNLIVLCRGHHQELEPSAKLTEPMEV